MQRVYVSVLSIGVAILGLAVPAAAQTPRTEISGGYQFVTFDMLGLDRVDAQGLVLRRDRQSDPDPGRCLSSWRQLHDVPSVRHNRRQHGDHQR